MTEIQKINSELRTVAAQELERAIASELEDIDSMEEVDLRKLLLAEQSEDSGDDDNSTQ
jgi:hypothetical protein